MRRVSARYLTPSRVDVGSSGVKRERAIGPRERRGRIGGPESLIVHCVPHLPPPPQDYLVHYGTQSLHLLAVTCAWSLNHYLDCHPKNIPRWI